MRRSVWTAYTRALRFLVTRSFDIWQAIGVHVALNHFYWPVPDTRELDSTFFARRSELPGVDMNPTGQLAFLAKVCMFRDEYARIPRDRIANGAFEAVDAEVLYSVVRAYRPKRVLEVGAGNSTWFTQLALSRNGGGELTTVDPYPQEWLHSTRARLLQRRAQDIPLDEFLALEENDLLFVDSSHVLKSGSDVQFLYLEVVPRLRAGVLVHFHDIFLPAEYPERWVKDELRFWNEQYLLQAFLAFNSAFEVLWSASWMHVHHPERLAEAFPTYAPGVWPASLWVRRRMSG